MLLATFRVQYPEFRSVGDPMLQSFLDVAAGRLDKTVWGSDWDQGHGLKTAALLANSPNGQGMARLETGKYTSESTYQVEFDTLTKIVGTGLRVF